MFSKAKRFEPLALKNNSRHQVKRDSENPLNKVPSTTKNKAPLSTPSKINYVDTQSQCSSVTSTKSFKTPKPIISTQALSKTANSLKKTLPSTKTLTKKTETKEKENDILKALEVEIRNKDYTISEYNKQIEDLNIEISKLHKRLQDDSNSNKDVDNLDNQLSQIKLNEENADNAEKKTGDSEDYTTTINKLKYQILELEKQCDKLDQEVSCKQVELTSLEEVITIRDSLCTDLQKKLTDMESILDETQQRLEMVKGHHALALEANESIRREYKVELETLKSKLEDEKQAIIAKSKSDQENLKQKYNTLIETIKNDIIREKEDKIQELQHELIVKDQEMKAKFEQIDEATHEKLRLCEIQFEERSRHLQEHWSQQHKEIQCLENEIKELKLSIEIAGEKNNALTKEISNIQHENDILKTEKLNMGKELEDMKDETKKRVIDFENAINKLSVEVDKATKDKNKFEMSLSVTRDIVHVLTLHIQESDKDLEHLENQVKALTNSKEVLESELVSHKNTLNNTVLECNEYKEALVNILKSKAALAKEHNRIMEHNVTLIESLQNVEKEAYRELGTIKNELIEDVELIKKESNSQIQKLRDEVEKKRMLCEQATEHAGQATAAADKARAMLAQAAAAIARLEQDNHCLQQQIQDQQSLVVELSLLRQENEELTMALAKQSSLMDKMKREAEQVQTVPKSPSVIRKSHKIGKENIQTVISPLRERNH